MESARSALVAGFVKLLSPRRYVRIRRGEPWFAHRPTTTLVRICRGELCESPTTLPPHLVRIRRGEPWFAHRPAATPTPIASESVGANLWFAQSPNHHSNPNCLESAGASHVSRPPPNHPTTPIASESVGATHWLAHHPAATLVRICRGEPWFAHHPAATLVRICRHLAAETAAHAKSLASRSVWLPSPILGPDGGASTGNVNKGEPWLAPSVPSVSQRIECVSLYSINSVYSVADSVETPTNAKSPHDATLPFPRCWTGASTGNVNRGEPWFAHHLAATLVRICRHPAAETAAHA